MKHLTAIILLGVLFCSAFVEGKSPAVMPTNPDSLSPVRLYTEGIKQYAIAGDTLRAEGLFREAIRRDSTYAPAYYELAANGMYQTPAEAVELARTAFGLDTTNKWYHQFYAQTLIYADRYDEALKVYRNLTAADPKDPDNYRIMAALYEQRQNPYMALAMLDSAEIRFGRIPMLGAMKRRLLIATGQTDKAIVEAKALVEATPYDDQTYVALAELYGISGKDSLALAEFNRAMQIDSTSITTLAVLADFHSNRHDYHALLEVIKRLFMLDELPLESKVRRFEQLTTDTRFYREYFPQLNNLASTLAIRYPNDKRVVELYAKHLIASGELEQALALYKLHLPEQPPVEEYFSMVIDIESYLQRPDSVDHYVNRALELFPGKVAYHLAKGNVMNVTRQYDRALEAYKESLRYAPGDSLRSAIWGLIGDTWHLKAESLQRDSLLDFGLAATKGPARAAMKACYKAYDRSLKYDKDNVPVMNNYAYFLSLDGTDLEKALAMSTRVQALTSNNPTYLDTHAWVLFRMGRAAEAKKIMQQAIALDRQGSPDLMVHFGDILQALGERFMAETYWRKALEKGYDQNEITRRLESEDVKKE